MQSQVFHPNHLLIWLSHTNSVGPLPRIIPGPGIRKTETTFKTQKPAELYRLASLNLFTLPCLAFLGENPVKALASFPLTPASACPNLVLLYVALGSVVGPLISGNKSVNFFFQWHWPLGVITQSLAKIKQLCRHVSTYFRPHGISQFETALLEQATWDHSPPSTSPILLNHSPLAILGSKKLPPITPFWSASQLLQGSLARSSHSSFLFHLLSMQIKKKINKINKNFTLKKKSSKHAFSNCVMELSSSGPVRVCTLSRPPPRCPFHSLKLPAQPLGAFDLETPALDFKACRPEEDSSLLFISIAVSYLSSQLWEPLQFPFHPNTMA